MRSHQSEPAPAGDPARNRDLRRVVGEVGRQLDAAQERVPAPVLRVLVALPWLLRRLPVPLWVTVVFALLRRRRRRRARAAARAGAGTSTRA